MPIEIDEANGLHIPDTGPGNRERFAAIFRTVWEEIKPPEDRERIILYWRKFKGSPMIDLVSKYRYPGETADYGCII